MLPVGSFYMLQRGHSRKYDGLTLKRMNLLQSATGELLWNQNHTPKYLLVLKKMVTILKKYSNINGPSLKFFYTSTESPHFLLVLQSCLMLA